VALKILQPKLLNFDIFHIAHLLFFVGISIRLIHKPKLFSVVIYISFGKLVPLLLTALFTDLVENKAVFVVSAKKSFSGYPERSAKAVGTA